MGESKPAQLVSAALDQIPDREKQAQKVADVKEDVRDTARKVVGEVVCFPLRPGSIKRANLRPCND